MRNWLRDNVLYDRLQDLWAGGCLTVARYLAAACVLMLAGMVACGCARSPKGPAYPARDDVHAAIFASLWGIKQLDQACADEAMTDMKRGNMNGALWLAQSCADHLEQSKAELVAAVEEMDDYGPLSYRKIGCNMAGTLDAYRAIRGLLAQRGLVDVDFEDGQARTEYLIGLAVGKCGK